jgi:hypothetical protein
VTLTRLDGSKVLHPEARIAESELTGGAVVRGLKHPRAIPLEDGELSYFQLPSEAVAKAKSYSETLIDWDLCTLAVEQLDFQAHRGGNFQTNLFVAALYFRAAFAFSFQSESARPAEIFHAVLGLRPYYPAGHLLFK